MKEELMSLIVAYIKGWHPEYKDCKEAVKEAICNYIGTEECLDEWYDDWLLTTWQWCIADEQKNHLPKDLIKRFEARLDHDPDVNAKRLLRQVTNELLAGDIVILEKIPEEARQKIKEIKRARGRE